MSLPPRRCGAVATACAALLAGCAVAPTPGPARSPEAIQADILALIPEPVAQRAAWAVDLQTVFAGLAIEPSVSNVCAVLAVTEQESSFNADPPVPNLARIARAEIDRRAERLGVPGFAVSLALQLRSADGRTYEQRLAAVRTERELSELFEAFIGAVPLGQRLFGGWNPVRTGGAMQVSIDFAETQMRARPYPFPAPGSTRQEVFTRRGGLYFGTAHLLDYPAVAYGTTMLYRFADFNAGRWASRNAAFQKALSVASGRTIDLDGDLFVADPTQPGQTETAARSLAAALGLSAREIRRDLERSRSDQFDRSDLALKVFALAEQRSGQAQARAVIPRIVLQSPKITRKLTTEWFARRVETRYQRCLQRGVG